MERGCGARKQFGVGLHAAGELMRLAPRYLSGGGQRKVYLLALFWLSAVVAGSAGRTHLAILLKATWQD